MNPVLARFSPEARALASTRVYDQEIPSLFNAPPHRGCRDGLCIFGVMIRHDFPDYWHMLLPSQRQVPSERNITVLLTGQSRGPEYHNIYAQVRQIVDLNDGGKLVTPEQVEALFRED